MKSIASLFAQKKRAEVSKLFLAFCLIAILTGCVKNEPVGMVTDQPAVPAAQAIATNAISMANPASAYCEQAGYTLQMREVEGGTYGVCLFPDGSECEEWAFYRGECQPADSSVTPAASSVPPTAVPMDAEESWQLYVNEPLGYSFRFPADADIMPDDNPLQTITIRGPLENDEYWPMINISHPGDREEFQLPEGADIVDWLVENNLLMTTDVQSASEVRQADIQIAGRTAVHTRFERSPHSYAYDKYFFADNGQLYAIVILHTGDKEDWELYDHFLQSFRFSE